MTWWGALGLALSLYGVVVLLEWLYDQILGSHSHELPAVSVVLRVMNQEGWLERVVRDLESIFARRAWQNRPFEVVLADSGSSDRTRDILERLVRHQPYFRVAEGTPSVDDLVSGCRYPVVIWCDLTDSATAGRAFGALARVLAGERPPE